MTPPLYLFFCGDRLGCISAGYWTYSWFPRSHYTRTRHILTMAVLSLFLNFLSRLFKKIKHYLLQTAWTIPGQFIRNKIAAFTKFSVCYGNFLCACMVTICLVPGDHLCKVELNVHWGILLEQLTGLAGGKEQNDGTGNGPVQPT